MIVEKTYKILKESHPEIKEITITDVVIGMHLACIRLSDNSVGVASALEDTKTFCAANRDFDDFTPTQIKGKKITELFESAKQSNITGTLKMAVLNAISSRMFEDSAYTIITKTDPVDLVDLSKIKTVTVIGAFQSYIHRFANAKHHLTVLELDKDSLSEDQQQYFVPAADYKKVIPKSDLVIITGFTLVNNTLDDILKSVSENTQVIVTGPSSSLIPDILFENNVNYIGAVRIKDKDLLFQVVGQGGHGYHLFKYCAEKICIVNEKG